MTYALRDFEQHIIQIAIKLANSRRPSEAQKAISAFRPVCSIGHVDNLLLPGGESECVKYRDMLRDWFDRISKANELRKKVAEEVNSILWDAAKLNLKLIEKRNFRYIETVLRFKTTDGVLAMATALILDESYGLTSRLKQCGNPKCGKFNLNIKPNGRPRTHCNPTCKKAADKITSADRQRASRAGISVYEYRQLTSKQR